MKQTACPCGLPAGYAECCGRYHGGVVAPTAEALMRSRYSAYVVGDTAYLLATWHPATRPEELTLHEALHWTGLEVLATTGGGPDDSRGSVSFVAHYERSGTAGNQHENSSFRRSAGRWVYVAEVFTTS